MPAPQPNPAPRAPLSRERILRAALELVDERGIDALTMRKLGETLGFEAMSLYNYVASKDDVIDGILDLVLAETDLPAPEGEWDDAVRASAISVFHSLRDHGWAAGLLMDPDRLRPARLQYMEWLLARLRQGGLSAETTFTAYHVLDAYIFGFAVWLRSHTFTEEQTTQMAAAFADEVTLEEFPYLREHGEQHFTEGPHREVSAFEFGLDLILDGLKRGA
jgi:AcrR family transcriptional regulator